MSDTIPDISSLLDSSLNQSPADTAAALATLSGVQTNAAAAGADPEQVDPQTSVDPGDPYEMQPDSEVSLPDPEPATSPEPQAQPEPAAPVESVEPFLTEAESSFAESVKVIENAEAAYQEASQRLADAQNNAEGIAEYSQEMEVMREAKDDAKLALHNARAEVNSVFNEISDTSLEAVMAVYPELRDDKHPATIAVKLALQVSPETMTETPTTTAKYAAEMCKQIRATAGQRPASQPKPTPGPVPPKTPAPAAVMQSQRQATAPAPGQPRTPDIVTQVAEAAKSGSLAELIEKTLGSAGPSIRMS